MVKHHFGKQYLLQENIHMPYVVTKFHTNRNAQQIMLTRLSQQFTKQANQQISRNREDLTTLFTNLTYIIHQAMQPTTKNT